MTFTRFCHINSKYLVDYKFIENVQLQLYLENSSFYVCVNRIISLK
jgi:hypothetical protein